MREGHDLNNAAAAMTSFKDLRDTSCVQQGIGSWEFENYDTDHTQYHCGYPWLAKAMASACALHPNEALLIYSISE
jgi:hypothetical protein